MFEEISRGALHTPRGETAGKVGIQVGTSVVVECDHCKRPNRITGEKKGRTRCGACGLPMCYLSFGKLQGRAVVLRTYPPHWRKPEP
jgi:hypothetical protein